MIKNMIINLKKELWDLVIFVQWLKLRLREKTQKVWVLLKSKIEFFVFLDQSPKIYKVKIYYLENDGYPKSDVYYPLLISIDTLRAMICAGIIYAISTFEPARLYSHHSEEDLHIEYYRKRESYYGHILFQDIEFVEIEKILGEIEAEEVK